MCDLSPHLPDAEPRIKDKDQQSPGDVKMERAHAEVVRIGWQRMEEYGRGRRNGGRWAGKLYPEPASTTSVLVIYYCAKRYSKLGLLIMTISFC